MSRSITRHMRCTAVLFGLLTSTAMADEAALYGPAAPDGSAFVRAYNADSAPLDINLGSLRLSDVGPKASSTFKFLPAGSYSAASGSKSLPVTLAADQYYTLVQLSGGELKLVEDPLYRSKQKALVRLQNLSDAALTVKTLDGKTEVIKAVAAQQRGEREINPVKVRLALFAGERKVSDLDPLVLERGEVVCLYVTGSGNKLQPVWVKRPLTDD